MNRRTLLAGASAAVLAASTAPRALVARDAAAFEVTRAAAEWRAMLSNLEY